MHVNLIDSTISTPILHITKESNNRSQSDERRLLRPIVAAPRPLVAVVVERAHVGGIEWRRQDLVEVAADEGKVVVDAVALRDVVDPDHIVVAGRGDHGGDRAAGDAERAALDRGPFGIEPSIADDEGARLDHRLTRTPALVAVSGE